VRFSVLAYVFKVNLFKCHTRAYSGVLFLFSLFMSSGSYDRIIPTPTDKRLASLTNVLGIGGGFCVLVFWGLHEMGILSWVRDEISMLF
jgi:hypothetical protein